MVSVNGGLRSVSQTDILIHNCLTMICDRLCLIAISLRLAYTPADYFSGDWTFEDVFLGMLFLIELNLVTITVLAPNLPVFFKKTSTGGVYFLLGEAVGRSKNDTRGSKKKNTYFLSSIPWSTSKSEGVTYTSEAEHNVTSTFSQRREGKNGNEPSFDSDRILIRTSIEVERRSFEREISGSQRSGEVQTINLDIYVQNAHPGSPASNLLYCMNSVEVLQKIFPFQLYIKGVCSDGLYEVVIRELRR